MRAACHNHTNEVLATEGNLNNNIGLPLNMVRLSNQHRYAVLEMGMNHFGEIEYLTQLVKPQVAVITNAGEGHLEGVGDISGVAKAKGEIFSGLSDQGTAILNRDDAHYDYWLKVIGSKKHLTFGLNNKADVTATQTSPRQINLQTPNGNIDVALPLLGRHNIMNALAATAATLALGIELTAIKQGLEQVKPAPGRMHLYTLANQVNVIDDTYNANPLSTRAAVDTLATFSGQRVLVLGDMKELGSEAKQLHFTSGQYIKKAGIDRLFTFGNLTAATTEGFGDHAQHFTDRDALVAALQPYLTQSNTTLLVKGSRSMHMEKVIAKIIPEEQLEHLH